MTARAEEVINDLRCDVQRLQAENATLQARLDVALAQLAQVGTAANKACPIEQVAAYCKALADDDHE